MNIFRKLVQQQLENARKPAGVFGRFLVWAMNVSHYQMTGWGLRQVAIGKQDTILDIGCGGGVTIHRLAGIARNGKVYGVDYSEESVAVSRMTNRQFVERGQVEIRQGSVSCLPFADNTFDLATAVNTHFFWPDLVADMREVLRVLKPGGRLVVIGNLYEGGKHERRNRNYASLVELAFPGVAELGEVFLKAGYAEVRTSENSGRNWMCCVGRKPANPQSPL